MRETRTVRRTTVTTRGLEGDRGSRCRCVSSPGMFSFMFSFYYYSTDDYTQTMHMLTMTTTKRRHMMSLGYLVSYFFYFFFIFYLTNSFLDMLLILWHTAPLFWRRHGNKSCSRDNAQETSYNVSWAFSTFFFFSFPFILYYLLFFFLDKTHFPTTTTHLYDDDDDDDDDDERRLEMRLRLEPQVSFFFGFLFLNSTNYYLPSQKKTEPS